MVNVEERVYGKKLRKPVPNDAVLILTRTTYRKNLRAGIPPSPTQEYIVSVVVNVLENNTEPIPVAATKPTISITITKTVECFTKT